MRISDWSSDVCSSDLQIVVEAEVETAEPGIALTARAAAQLIVDAAALVAFGAEHEQPAGGEHFVLLDLDLLADALDRLVALRPFLHLGQLGFARSEEHTSELQSLMRK